MDIFGGLRKLLGIDQPAQGHPVLPMAHPAQKMAQPIVPQGAPIPVVSQPSHSQPTAGWSGVQPATSLDETLQGNPDIRVQGGQVNPGFIPLQTSSASSLAHIQPSVQDTTRNPQLSRIKFEDILRRKY